MSKYSVAWWFAAEVTNCTKVPGYFTSSGHSECWCATDDGRTLHKIGGFDIENMDCHRDDFIVVFAVMAGITLLVGILDCCLFMKAKTLVDRPFFNPGMAQPSLVAQPIQAQAV